MFRDCKPPSTDAKGINCLITDGGMGDLLCALTPVNYLINNVPWTNPQIWVPDYMLEFSKHVLPKKATVRDFTNGHQGYNPKKTSISTRWQGQHTPMRVHPIDYSYHVLLDCNAPTLVDRNYLSIRPKEIDISHFNLPNKYVVVPVGSTANTKELSVAIIEDLSNYIIKKGYTPVYVGKKESAMGFGDFKVEAKLAEADYSKGINLLDKTSLLELSGIISGARAIVGMEGGTIHLAGFTETAIVAGYTFINPEIMGIIRHGQMNWNCFPITPPESLGCRFCQSHWTLLYGHDFRQCWYGPNDYSCVKSITTERFIEQLEKIL